MEFRNLTPFGALCFGALDPADQEHRVVAMKVGYRLLREGDTWQAQVMDEEPQALCMADEYMGEPGVSSVLQESDLAPYKPRCDLIVHGSAHAPAGQAARHWESRLRVSTRRAIQQASPAAPQPLNPLMALTLQQQAQWEQEQALARERHVQASEWEVALDKRLHISGPSELRRRWLWPGWRRTRAQPATRVPLLWENAFGGQCRVADPKHPEAPPLFNEVCFSNPLGQGWQEKRWAREARRGKQTLPRRLAAPQIEYPGQLLRGPVVSRHPDQESDAHAMAHIAQGYGQRPAGLGVVGRAWAPRLQRAGTYGPAWLEQRHPGLPEDFDCGYWNGAPEDQQMGYLPPDARIELWNLSPPENTAEGHFSLVLPGHRAFVLMRLHNGVLLPLPMVTDTVRIDTDAMTLSLTHRTWVSAALVHKVRALEARFETDPSAPLITASSPPLLPQEV